MATYVFNGITYTPQLATANSQTIFGKTKNSWIQVLGGINTVFGGSGDNVVLVGVKPVYIVPPDPHFFGREVIGATGVGPNGSVPGGTTTIYLGAGNDYVSAGSGREIVYLGEGNNIFDGQDAQDGALGDIVYAGSGNDIIEIGGGGTVYAGDGNNQILTYGYRDINGPNKTYAGSGNDQIRSYGSVVTGSNLIYAGEGNNKVYATANENTIYCGAGNDLIIAEGTNSLVYAGEGNNNIHLFGTSTVYSGSGRDVFTIRSRETAVSYGGYTPGVATIVGYGANDAIDTAFLGRVIYTDYDMTYVPATITLTQSQGDVLLGADGATVARLKNTQIGNVRLISTSIAFGDEIYYPFNDVVKQFN
jgi:Ca2+-binding RTX toxin-like protein